MFHKQTLDLIPKKLFLQTTLLYMKSLLNCSFFRHFGRTVSNLVYGYYSTDLGIGNSTHTHTHKLYPKHPNRWNSSLSSQCNLHCKSDLNLTSSLLIAFLYITCCLEYTNRFESFNWIISNQRQITIKIFARATILTIFHAWTVLKILNNAVYLCTRYLCIKHHEIETLLFLLKTAKHSLSHDSSKAHLLRHESNFSFSKARQTWFSFSYRISQELQYSLSKNFKEFV